MKIFRWFFLLLGFVLLWVLPVKAASAASFAPEEIIVQFRPLVPQGIIEKITRDRGAKIKEKLFLPRTFVLRVPKGQEENLAKVFSGNPLVSYAELNFEAWALEIPNDTYFSNQWGMSKVQAPEAWDISHGASSATIAILDTGIDKDHEDLTAKVVARVNFTDSSSDDDLYGHGTHVAGIVGAQTNNALGVAGLGYEASLMSVKVLNDSGSGYYSWVANGITWAADNGARIVNLSLGGSSGSTTLKNAVDYAWSKGVVLACAAGNNGNTLPIYPAYYASCIATAATDSSDKKASWSTYGSWVDVAAPGVDIYSTMPNHANKIGPTNYGTLSGTSMATPHVAGLAGLLFGYNLSLSNSQVRGAIETYADDIAGTGTYWSQGRINAYRSLSSLTAPTPTPTPTPTGAPTPTSTPSPEPTPTPSPTPTPGPSVLCWSGSNQYLYRAADQSRKFCKCAQGTYGYNSYKYSWGTKKVYKYLDPANNENWGVTSASSYTPVYSVTCTDGKAYPTNVDYYWP
ncbi:MAG: S8 family peptidase [Patescibacteria group bacterium]